METKDYWRYLMENKDYSNYNTVIKAMKDYKTKKYTYGFDEYDRWGTKYDSVNKLNDEIDKYINDTMYGKTETPAEFDLKTTEDTKPVKVAIEHAVEPSIIDEVKNLRAEVAQLRAVVSALTAIIEENC